MSKKAAFVFVSSLVMMFAQTASGNDKRVNVEVVSAVRVGQGFPKVIVLLKEPALSLALSLAASDGTRIERNVPRARAGRHEMDLRQNPGSVTWTGQLVVEFKGEGKQELDLSFDTTLRDVPKLTHAQHAVDLEKRTVTVQVDSEGGSIELRVISDEGAELFLSTQAFEGVAANEERTVSWQQPDDARVFRIDVRAVDPHGFYSELELYPWHINVPHEDVLFRSGEAVLHADEIPKLELAWKELKLSLEKYGRFAQVQLFIAGHTDTVGDSASNRALSEARSIAIGRWFQKRGVQVPIFHAGLGESRPLVQTADETDEPLNRRAEYIVAVEPPSGVSWKRVK